MRVGLEHFGQSVLLLVSMTFLRSPVLAIFAIMLALPDTKFSAHALDVLMGCYPSRASRIESSGTSRKDCPGLATAGIGWRRTAIEALLQVYTTRAIAGRVDEPMQDSVEDVVPEEGGGGIGDAPGLSVSGTGLYSGRQ